MTHDLHDRSQSAVTVERLYTGHTNSSHDSDIEWNPPSSTSGQSPLYKVGNAHAYDTPLWKAIPSIRLRDEPDPWNGHITYRWMLSDDIYGYDLSVVDFAGVHRSDDEEDDDLQLWEIDDPTSSAAVACGDMETIVVGIANLLEDRCRLNAKNIILDKVRGPAQRFFSVDIPAIPLKLYIWRVIKNIRCSRSVALVAVVILSRLEALVPMLGVTPFNVHRLVLTALLLSSKFLEDDHRSNGRFAKAGGLPTTAEMNNLEYIALNAINYNVFTKRRDFDLVAKLVETWARLPPELNLITTHDSLGLIYS